MIREATVSLLLFVLIVVVVIALACWIISIGPFPSQAPASIKTILMAFVAAIGLIVILLRVPGIT